MNISVHPGHPNLVVYSREESRTRRRSDWRLVALMAGLLVVLLIGMARRVDLQVLPSAEEAPLLMGD